MSTTDITKLFQFIKVASEEGELGHASELAHQLMNHTEGNFYLTDEEEQYLDWIHGQSIYGRPFRRSEIDPELWDWIQKINECGPPEDTSEIKRLMRSAFYDQGKYPMGMHKGRVLYWYFQNMPWSTSLKISIVDEVESEMANVLWQGVVSHRDMATVMHPDENPHLFWPNMSEGEVNNRVLGYKAWKYWRRVHKV